MERVIFLTDYALEASIGFHDFELEQKQRLLVSVELRLDEDHASDADDVADLLDYDFIRQEISDLVGSKHFNLQETLADEIMALCQAKPGVTGVRITTKKPDVYPDCAAVGYRLSTF